MFSNIANFNNTGDYLPLLNGVLLTDMFVILLSNTRIIDSRVLRQWYENYNLSAVVADILIIFIWYIRENNINKLISNYLKALK